MDKQFWAKALGWFMYACLEQVLGKTKFGGLLGLAKWVSMAILRRTLRVLSKPFIKQGPEGPTKGE